MTDRREFLQAATAVAAAPIFKVRRINLGPEPVETPAPPASRTIEAGTRAGETCVVELNGVAITTNVQSVNLQEEADAMDVMDVTDFGDSQPRYLPGRVRQTLTMRLVYHRAADTLAIGSHAVRISVGGAVVLDQPMTLVSKTVEGQMGDLVRSTMTFVGGRA
jgi:hypothetical protein